MSNKDKYSEITQSLINKTITKKELLNTLKEDTSLIPLLLNGLNSSKAAIRYGLAKVLMDFSKDDPQKLYPHLDIFIKLLDSKYRILIWNALAIIANLTRVDSEKKFDSLFEKYYSLLKNEYMVTVANVVGNSITIAKARPDLIQNITKKLLTIQDLSLTPHLTEECKKVISQETINFFDLFYDKIDNKDDVKIFVKACQNSSRIKLRTIAEKFLEKWS